MSEPDQRIHFLNEHQLPAKLTPNLAIKILTAIEEGLKVKRLLDHQDAERR